MNPLSHALLFARRLRTRLQQRTPDSNLPDWGALLEREAPAWGEAREAARGPEVLIASAVGGFSALTSVESMLAVALTLRGARVHLLLCDSAMPACLRAEFNNISEENLASGKIATTLCPGCEGQGRKLFEPLGLPLHWLSRLLSEEDRRAARDAARTTDFSRLPAYRLDGLAVGEHANAGALRYFARGDLASERNGEAIAKRFLEAGVLSARALQRLTGEVKFASAVFNHGIYAPHGVFGEVCRARHVPVVNWNVAYRKGCFIFSHGDSYHHTLMDEPTTTWEAMPWNDEMEAAVDRYLKSRWQGTQDWIWFHERPEEDWGAIAARLGIAAGKPLIGMLTNVVWDAQLHYRANAFSGMLEWVHETIGYFARRPELQLVIRVHPAEIRGGLPSRQPLVAEIAKRWPQLPANVFVIPPESRVSTYAVLEQCDCAVIYGTKMGVELSSVGIPVIVGGEAWIRNKGLTMDARTAEEYFRLLDRLPLGRRLDRETVRRAKMYAYHFFFRRMMPLEVMEPAEGKPPYRVKVERLADLRPGNHRGLDIVCDGILKGMPFVFPAESSPQRKVALGG
jgi:hypothetical protein